MCARALLTAQEHFYLEPHVTHAEPGEAGELRVWASTQNPTKTQHKVATVLGVQQVSAVVMQMRHNGIAADARYRDRVA